jgi:hypothetical protein
MAKKKDLKALGDVYSKLGAEVVVSEKNDMIIGDKDISVGEAPLADGGITKDAGVKDPKEAEGTKAPGVEDDTPKAELAGKPEEDEENAAEALETASAGINNYMAKKSAFDELFAKVISEDFGMDEQDDLNALGIEDATPDAELGEEGDDDASEEEVTITLDKDMCQKLCDILKAACGEEDGDEAADEDVADELEATDDEFDPEEDNEGAPTAFNTHYNDGKSNKVGHAEGPGQPKVQAANKVAHKPTAGPGDTDGKPQAHGDHYDDGKNNKVGNHSHGDAFGTLKVQPKNKEVKAG